MLYTCDNHDDCVVVYDTRNCPACVMVDRIAELEKEVTDLKDEVKSLEGGAA